MPLATPTARRAVRSLREGVLELVDLGSVDEGAALEHCLDACIDDGLQATVLRPDIDQGDGFIGGLFTRVRQRRGMARLGLSHRAPPARATTKPADCG